MSQGHPTTVFYYLKGGEKFLDDPTFKYNLRSLSDKFPTIVWSLLFHISQPRLDYFSYKKKNLKFSDTKMWQREESENYHSCNTLNCIKTKVALGWPNRYKFSSAA